jgi:hypothetical protein
VTCEVLRVLPGTEGYDRFVEVKWIAGAAEFGGHREELPSLTAVPVWGDAARHENHHASRPTEPTSVPIGLASFAYDVKTVRRFAERDHANIVSWNTFDRGSHWAAHDAPDLLADDIRQFFASLR